MSKEGADILELPTAQQAGRAYEVDLAKRIGGRVVPGSGSKPFAKLDVGKGALLLSAKKTGAASFRVADDLFQEVDDAINGPGGVGDNVLGAVVTKTATREVISMDLSKFMALLGDGNSVISSTLGKSQIDKTPHLMR